MLRYLTFLLLVGVIALSSLWGSLAAESESLILPTLAPLTEQTATPTATQVPAAVVQQGFAVAPAAPPDVSQAYAVTWLGHNQVSVSYLNQAVRVFDCGRLNADVIFAGLANHQQYQIRTLCEGH